MTIILSHTTEHCNLYFAVKSKVYYTTLYGICFIYPLHTWQKADWQQCTHPDTHILLQRRPNQLLLGNCSLSKRVHDHFWVGYCQVMKFAEPCSWLVDIGHKSIRWDRWTVTECTGYKRWQTTSQGQIGKLRVSLSARHCCSLGLSMVSSLQNKEEEILQAAADPVCMNKFIYSMQVNFKGLG